jgi:hypothetical protein
MTNHRIGSPRIPIKFWNACTRIKNGAPRTTNNAENFNKVLNLRMQTTNPNIAQFISTFLNCEEFNILNLKRCIYGCFDTKSDKRENLILQFARNC